MKSVPAITFGVIFICMCTYACKSRQMPVLESSNIGPERGSWSFPSTSWISQKIETLNKLDELTTLQPLPADPEERALRYLTPELAASHPPLSVSEERPNFEDNNIIYHRCWKHADGLVCIACYVNTRFYYASIDVLCPFAASTPCRYIYGEDDNRKYGINMVLNECIDVYKKL